MDRDTLLRCIDECLDCGASCTACAQASLSEPDVQEMLRVIRLCADCADECDATARVVTRQTAPDLSLMRAMIEACATACVVCAEECGLHAAHGDEAIGVGGLRSGDEIARSFGAHAVVARGLAVEFRERVGKVGRSPNLIDDRVGAKRHAACTKRVGVDHVTDDRLCSQCRERHLRAEARHARHDVTGVDEQR